MIKLNVKFLNRRPARMVLVNSMARAIIRLNTIEYFLGVDSVITLARLFECTSDGAWLGPAALVSVKYLAMEREGSALKTCLYEAVSDYWRDHGVEYGPSRFPYPLRRDMCALAIAEHIDPMAQICRDCQGSGRITNKIGCKPCQGSGRVIFTDEDRAVALAQPTHDFIYSWREFYQVIRQILTDWEALALTECRDQAG